MKTAYAFLVLITCAGCGATAPDAAAVRQHMSSDQLDIGEPVVNGAGMVLVPIPPGEFDMGTARKKGDKGKGGPDTPRHRVKISRAFFIGAFEVTQGQYENVMGESPWKGKPLVQAGDDYAATYVSWEDAARFCETLSERESATYRLPTEAEWEYACRAGTNGAYSFDKKAKLQDYAWFDANAYKAGEQYPHMVGQKLPNGWALFDMHGNVWEWCQDFYGPYSAMEEIAVDPTGPEKGWVRVWRGGCFSENAINLRSATRVSFGRPGYRPEYLVGFRVVKEIEESE